MRAAILGFLDLDPTSGYSLKQRFEGSVGSFWSVTQSQIYRELHALEREKKVVAKREAGDGAPDRKVYALTKAGREELQAWLRAPLEPLQLRHPLLLKFVFAADVPPEELDAVLSRYEASLEVTRAEYRGRLLAKEIFSLARNKREAAMWVLSIEHGLAWCDTELEWLKKTRKALFPGGTRAGR
ncbi:MAG: PadR family transcriptional regulator [Myxococcaceae bacterium]|nr:PadR family transcriptional regulator [Myxococcaceae bacterium]